MKIIIDPIEAYQKILKEHNRLYAIRHLLPYFSWPRKESEAFKKKVDKLKVKYNITVTPKNCNRLWRYYNKKVNVTTSQLNQFNDQFMLPSYKLLLRSLIFDGNCIGTCKHIEPICQHRFNKIHMAYISQAPTAMELLNGINADIIKLQRYFNKISSKG